QAADDHEPDHQSAQHRHGEGVRHDHRAGEVARLPLELESAVRAARVHREEPAPQATLETARAAQPQDRADPAHQKYSRTMAAMMIETAAATMRTSGSR